MANTIKESKGRTSQKHIMTKRVCDLCGKNMLQSEIETEIHYVGYARPRRRIMHAKAKCG